MSRVIHAKPFLKRPTTVHRLRSRRYSAAMAGSRMRRRRRTEDEQHTRITTSIRVIFIARRELAIPQKHGKFRGQSWKVMTCPKYTVPVMIELNTQGSLARKGSGKDEPSLSSRLVSGVETPFLMPSIRFLNVLRHVNASTTMSAMMTASRAPSATAT